MSKTISPDASREGATTNHDRVRRWAATRDAQPARRDDADGGLRFRFPVSDRFTPISWDAFFETFEREELAFVYEPEGTARAVGDDDRSNHFYKFVDRDSV